MRSEIPLKVLGLLAPILSWTERVEAQELPPGWSHRSDSTTWGGSSEAVSAREHAWLLHEFPTYSLDNIDEVIDYARFDGRAISRGSSTSPATKRLAPPAGYDLQWVLETLERRYLTWTGGKVTIRPNRMVELHELGLRLPLGAMVRHAHARAVAAGEQTARDVLELPEAIGLLPSSAHGLRAVVRRGLSEGHLHLNAIHTAEMTWAEQLLKPMVHRPREFEETDWRLLRLGRAAARMLALAATTALADADPPKEARDLLDTFDHMYFAATAADLELAALKHEKAWLEPLKSAYDNVQQVGVDASDSGGYRGRRRKVFEPIEVHLLRWVDPSGFEYQALLGKVIGVPLSQESRSQLENHLTALHFTAHLALMRAGRDVARGRQATGRRVPAGLTYRFVHGALFRYLVCRTHHWKRGVQQGRTTGLRHFQRFYNSPHRWPIEATAHANAEAVFARARDWRGLRVLEGRITPPQCGTRDIFPWLEAYAHGIDRGRVEKLGLVVHFIKDHERRRPSNLYSTEDPARFTDRRRQYRREAFRLFKMLEAPSLASPFIVGIDAANLELATPPEVFAPVFRFLRQRPIELREPETPDIDTWRRLDDIRRLVERRRLGMTYHVGEDFRHLLSGLRAIDEVLVFLDPQPGDRLGHAIALGLAPEVWAEQTGFQAIVPKLEWLDTLVWVHHLLGPADELVVRLKIADRIQRLGRELYQDIETQTPLLLYDAWRLRQLDPDNITLQADPPGRRTEPGSRPEDPLSFRPLDGVDTAAWRWNRIEMEKLRQLNEKIGVKPPINFLADYWFSPWTRAEGEKLILVDMETDADAWLTICRQAQERVQQRVADCQMAVEVNPSVNRVIGPMNRIAEHHAFALTLDDDNHLARRLNVTVNTDNPGTANTSLAHEYYLLGESLLRRGLPEAEVVRWLEWLRRNGEEFSFVRQQPSPGDPAMRRVIGELRNRRQPLRTKKDADAIVRELWRRIADPDRHQSP